MFTIDPHIHTAEISPCGKVNASRLVSLYKRAGYHGLIVTDHLSAYCPVFREQLSWREQIDIFFSGYDLIKEIGESSGLVILPGFELTFNHAPNDYLVYGIGKEWLYSHEGLLDSSIELFSEDISGEKALIIQAHPFRKNLIPREKPHIHGIEVYNGNPRHDSRNDKAHEYAGERQMVFSSGSDFHQEDDCCRGGLRFSRKILTIEDFIHGIQKDNPELIQTA